jgi:glycosyltransferase involved in cell wall biosynthesis
LTRIAFIFGNGMEWMGGMSYYDNLLTAIHLANSSQKHTLLGIFPHGDKRLKGLLHHFDEISYLPVSSLTEKVMNRAATWLNNRPNLAEFAPGSAISRACVRVKAEAVFLKQDPYANFRIPSVCWFPDFQYLHMPEMFDPVEAENYDRGVRHIALYATRVLLSSHATQKDFDRLLPEYKDKVQVIPFAAWINNDVYAEDSRQIVDEYHLAEKFFYLPNQFWKHKNHRIVLDALEICLRSNPNIMVAASGSMSDFRNPSYPSEFLAEIARRGLRENFVLLGLIPRKHVYALMRQSLAILQPSLFEGWSTSVEEAKSLGKQIIVSDLDVHREQNAAGAIYFNPHDAQGLAENLLNVQQNSKPGIDPLKEKQAYESMCTRTRDFGTSFLELMQQVAGS